MSRLYLSNSLYQVGQSSSRPDSDHVQSANVTSLGIVSNSSHIGSCNLYQVFTDNNIL